MPPSVDLCKEKKGKVLVVNLYFHGVAFLTNMEYSHVNK